MPRDGTSAPRRDIVALPFLSFPHPAGSSFKAISAGGTHTMIASLVRPPNGMGGFEFVVLATQRAAQLMLGCVPTVDPGDHKATVVARIEVSSGRIGHAQGPVESDTTSRKSRADVEMT
jgi:DNA-directed RNA polymerase subunit K/omega